MKRKGKKAKLNNSQRRRRRRDGRVGRAAGQSQGLKRERETYLVPCLPNFPSSPLGLTILCHPGTESFPLHLAAALILTVFI